MRCEVAVLHAERIQPDEKSLAAAEDAAALIQSRTGVPVEAADVFAMACRVQAARNHYRIRRSDTEAFRQKTKRKPFKGGPNGC